MAGILPESLVLLSVDACICWLRPSPDKLFAKVKTQKKSCIVTPLPRMLHKVLQTLLPACKQHLLSRAAWTGSFRVSSSSRANATKCSCWWSLQRAFLVKQTNQSYSHICASVYTLANPPSPILLHSSTHECLVLFSEFAFSCVWRKEEQQTCCLEPTSHVICSTMNLLVLGIP